MISLLFRETWGRIDASVQTAACKHCTLFKDRVGSASNVINVWNYRNELTHCWEGEGLSFLLCWYVVMHTHKILFCFLLAEYGGKSHQNTRDNPVGDGQTVSLFCYRNTFAYSQPGSRFKQQNTFSFFNPLLYSHQNSLSFIADK